MKTEALWDLLKDQLKLDGLKRVNHNYLACCPNHQESRPSWGISVIEPHVHGCFACGYKGTLRTLLIDQGWTRAKVTNLLGAQKKSALSWSLTATTKETKTILAPRETLWPFAPHSSEVLSYMQSRGIARSTCEKAGLLYDRKQHRVVFPWFCNSGLLGATGRTLKKETDEPKIVAYGGLKKGHALYIPMRWLDPEQEVILVEGESDALKVYQAGYRNVAALGHGRFTNQQEALLTNLPVKSVVLFFDNDRRGDELMFEVTDAMVRHCPVRKVKWTENDPKDPGDLKSSAIRRKLSKAKMAVNWSTFSP